MCVCVCEREREREREKKNVRGICPTKLLCTAEQRLRDVETGLIISFTRRAYMHTFIQKHTHTHIKICIMKAVRSNYTMFHLYSSALQRRPIAHIALSGYSLTAMVLST